ncbi:MAG: hypothetical protein Q9187_008801 [Circinaria calcarea]
MMITLLQCVKSARWPENSPISIFPGVDPQMSGPLKFNTQTPSTTQSLATLVESLPTSLRTLYSSLHIPPHLQTPFTKAVSTLPNLNLSVSQVNALGLTLTLTRQNAPTSSDYRVYTPKFPKPQTEGFFVIVSVGEEILGLKRVGWGATTRGEQVKGKISSGGGRGGKATAKAVMKLPDSEKERKVDVTVISDSYIGMEWRIEGVEVPAVPRGLEEGKKG